MPDTTELAQPVYNPTPEEIQSKINAGPVCEPGDKECLNRWVQAFSDCE